MITLDDLFASERSRKRVAKELSRMKDWAENDVSVDWKGAGLNGGLRVDVWLDRKD
jgi:hypothetical protein